MNARGRALPPLASDEDRRKAAQIAADKLCSEMREQALVAAVWAERPATWAHEVLADGSVVSKKS